MKKWEPVLNYVCTWSLDERMKECLLCCLTLLTWLWNWRNEWEAVSNYVMKNLVEWMNDWAPVLPYFLAVDEWIWACFDLRNEAWLSEWMSFCDTLPFYVFVKLYEWMRTSFNLRQCVVKPEWINIWVNSPVTLPHDRVKLGWVNDQISVRSDVLQGCIVNWMSGWVSLCLDLTQDMVAKLEKCKDEWKSVLTYLSLEWMNEWIGTCVDWNEWMNRHLCWLTSIEWMNRYLCWLTSILNDWMSRHLCWLTSVNTDTKRNE